MPLILKTKNFIVEGHDHPHHDRNNGGHLRVIPIAHYVDRTVMPMELYLSMMQLVLLAGEAVTTVMRGKGVEVVRINYQDNGNWAYFPSLQLKPQVHVQLYVRAQNEAHPEGDPRFRAFPNALVFPFVGDFPEYYRSFQPYSLEDCEAMRAEMERLLDTEKYRGVREKL